MTRRFLQLWRLGNISHKKNVSFQALPKGRPGPLYDDDEVDDNVEQVNLTLLVVAEVTPGLPTTCDVQVSVKVAFVNDDPADDNNGGDSGMTVPLS